jgi:hypothetical protein
MKGCTDNSNPSNKLPLYKTPNPFSIIKKIPKKVIPLVMKLTRLDRIAMEVLLATITIPDEEVKSYVETKLVRLLNEIEEPTREAMERLGQGIIEPLFRAIPFVNLTYILGDIQKATDSVDAVQGKGAQALESVVREARDLYGDIQGPSRALSSLILGLSNYIETIQEKIDNGESLTKEDTAAINMYKTLGTDYSGPPSRDTPKRTAARLVGAELVKKIREDEADGIIDPDRELIRNTRKFLKGDGETTGAETQEMEGELKGGLLDLLLGVDDEEKEERVKESRQKKSSKA